MLLVKQYPSWFSQPLPHQNVKMSTVFSFGSLRPFLNKLWCFALIQTLAQDWWNGANIDSIWARQITPPSCVHFLSLSFTLAQFPSNLPLPLSLIFPFIPFLPLPFFSLPLCPRLSASLSSLLEASQAVFTVGSELSSSSSSSSQLS